LLVVLVLLPTIAAIEAGKDIALHIIAGTSRSATFG